MYPRKNIVEASSEMPTYIIFQLTVSYFPQKAKEKSKQKITTSWPIPGKGSESQRRSMFSWPHCHSPWHPIQYQPWNLHRSSLRCCFAVQSEILKWFWTPVFKRNTPVHTKNHIFDMLLVWTGDLPSSCSHAITAAYVLKQVTFLSYCSCQIDILERYFKTVELSSAWRFIQQILPSTVHTQVLKF